MRSHFRNAPTEFGRENTLEDLWHAAVLLLGAAFTRSQVHLRIEYELALEVLQQGVARLSTALNELALAEAMQSVLPTYGISSSCVSLYEDSQCQTLRCIYAYRDGFQLDASGELFPSRQLVPTGFFPHTCRWSYLLMPLTFGTEQLGVIVMELGAVGYVYTMLREQIGSALKGAELHRNVVQQSRLRERAEHEQLRKETIIAKRIQTAILPNRMQVPGFELAAIMLPAAEVGGDYYDVIPTENGCWIGIGDVAGHGLLAGLEMLMIQSMTAAMVAQNPNASPKDLVIALNRALYENVRHRLERDDHATLTLIRVDHGGRLTFAGCHEDIIVCRSSSGTCELVPTPGFWVAVVPELEELTEEAYLSLNQGDLLVLYSDGIIESRNHQNEQFGIARLRGVIEATRTQSVRAICDVVLGSVKSWAAAVDDDLSIFVGRYTGTS